MHSDSEYKPLDSLDAFLHWLDNEMEKRGWNDSDLARYAGLRPSTISRLRGRERAVGWDALVAIAEALNTSPVNVLMMAGKLPGARQAQLDYQLNRHKKSINPRRDFANRVRWGQAVGIICVIAIIAIVVLRWFSELF